MIFTVLCHVCDKLHKIDALFLSGATRLHKGTEYRLYAHTYHSKNEIKLAYFGRSV